MGARSSNQVKKDQNNDSNYFLDITPRQGRCAPGGGAAGWFGPPPSTSPLHSPFRPSASPDQLPYSTGFLNHHRPVSVCSTEDFLKHEVATQVLSLPMNKKYQIIK